MVEDKAYLQFLITEDIYVLREEVQLAESPMAATEAPAEEVPKAAKKEVAEEKPTAPPTIKIPEVSEPKPLPLPTKKLLVVYQHKGSEKLPANLKEMMLKILEAIKVPVKEAAFVNEAYGQIPTPIETYHYVLVFSDSTALQSEKIDTSINYQIQQSGTTKVMLAHSLAALDKDKALKMKLWGMLKQMFAVERKS